MLRHNSKDKHSKLQQSVKSTKKRDIAAARSLLFYFCTRVKQKQPIRQEVLDYVAEALTKILGNEKPLNALGLVDPPGRRRAEADYLNTYLGACAWVEIHDKKTAKDPAYEKVSEKLQIRSAKTVARAYRKLIKQQGPLLHPDEIRAIARSSELEWHRLVVKKDIK